MIRKLFRPLSFLKAMILPKKNFPNLHKRVEEDLHRLRKEEGLTEPIDNIWDYVPKSFTFGKMNYEMQELNFTNPENFFFISTTDDPNRFALAPGLTQEKFELAIFFEKTGGCKHIPKTNETDIISMDALTGDLFHNQVADTLMVNH